MKPASPVFVLIAMALALGGCARGQTFNSTEDLGLIATGAQAGTPLPPEDPIYSDLPQGPRDTGTFPSFADQPVSRIGAMDQSDTNLLLAELTTLEQSLLRGTISTAQYRARLNELRRLAQNHSPEMLARIEAQAQNFDN